MSMTITTSADVAIASGAEHWVDKYSSKVPQFLHSSKVTLGNVTANWRFGDEEYHVSFQIKTESKLFYETIIGYHNAGTQFRLNNTEDLGDLMLKTEAGACSMNRIMDAKGRVAYEMNMNCIIVTEDI